jgi:hypothetical protein
MLRPCRAMSWLHLLILLSAIPFLTRGGKNGLGYARHAQPAEILTPGLKNFQF